MENARYLIEYYRDEYNTLHQGIEIDLKEDEASNGRTKPIRIERLINDDFVEIDVNTFKPVS